MPLTYFTIVDGMDGSSQTAAGNELSTHDNIDFWQQRIRPFSIPQTHSPYTERVGAVEKAPKLIFQP